MGTQRTERRGRGLSDRGMMWRTVPVAALAVLACAPTSSAFFVGSALPQLRSASLRSATPMRMSATEPVAAGAKLTFTQEMRAKAMSLHTFSQAPKEGKVRDKTANTVVEQWETTKEDFLQFLTDSLVVYEAFEKILHSTDELAPLRNSGMERVEGLKQDIAFIGTKYGLSAPAPSAAATEYAAFLNTIAVPVFVCHFYNYYFAHTAGGRMIGQSVMDSVFGGHLFEFYKWDRDVKEILTEVKSKIDGIAEKWTREQKDASLDATPITFSKSGALLRALVGKARDRAARMFNKVQVRKGIITGVSASPYASRKAAWDL